MMLGRITRVGTAADGRPSGPAVKGQNMKQRRPKKQAPLPGPSDPKAGGMIDLPPRTSPQDLQGAIADFFTLLDQWQTAAPKYLAARDELLRLVKQQAYLALALNADKHPTDDQVRQLIEKAGDNRVPSIA